MKNIRWFVVLTILLTGSLALTTGCPNGGLYGGGGGNGADDDDDGGNGGGDGVAHDFTAELTGGEEVPPVDSDATGSGTFTLNAEGTELTFDISLTPGLSGPVTVAHFHEGSPDVSGPVVFEITAFVEEAPDGSVTASGVWELGGGDTDAILDGDIYVNFHTELNPLGEVRGQLAEQD